jgi:hypothetical protein
VNTRRSPAGTPAGGQFAAGRHADAEVSLGEADNLTAWRAHLAERAADIEEHSDSAPVVVVVRHPDYSNEFYSFDGEGTPVIVDVDLGALFDGSPDDDDQAVEFVESHLEQAVRISHPDARAQYLETLRDVVTDPNDPSRFAAARARLDFAAGLDVRPASDPSAPESQIARSFPGVALVVARSPEATEAQLDRA